MDSPRFKNDRILQAAMIVAWAVAAAFVAYTECVRVANHPDHPHGWLTYFTRLDPDTSLFVPVVLAAPLLLYGRFKKGAHQNAGPRQPEATNGSETAPLTHSVLVACVAGVVAFQISSLVFHSTPPGSAGAVPFGDLPPAYHDEYSYLFQARTFLAGRTSFESQGPPGLFDQMHVLNEGRFASRYFPATGLWLAPFVAIGKPYLGQHLANALIAALVSLTASRAAGLFAGILAGLLVAVCPGMAVFSNLLLAHHATLLGLSLFLFAVLEARRSHRVLWMVVAGCGLTFAMLARPMSAAGFALPFGVWIVGNFLRRREERVVWRNNAVAIGIPIVVGLVGLCLYNKSITGELLTTPYSQYTNIYTPRHVYGFNNVKRGEQKAGPRTIEKYDRWATNLTPRRAAANVQRRLVAGFRWTLGVVPLIVFGTIGILLWKRLSFETQMALASIACLHIAHIPYWFDGIMGWHYVFETGVLWCLVAALITADLRAAFESPVRITAIVVVGQLCALAGSWLEVPNPAVADDTLWGTSRVDRELTGLRFSREKYRRFRARIDPARISTPALVLVRHDPADIHIEYVNNPPDLQADVLTGHELPEVSVEELRRHFPSRVLYRYSAVDDSLTLLSR